MTFAAFEKLRVDHELDLFAIEIEHARDLYLLVDSSRKSLREYLGWVDTVRSIEDKRKLIRYYQLKRLKNGALTFSIVHQNKLVGVIGLNEIRWPAQSTTIGYWLAEPFRGRGIMVRSCARLLDYVFRNLKLNRANILCAVDNTASQGIPQALGFVMEGRLIQAEWLYTRYVDLFAYGLLRSEYAHVSKAEPPLCRPRNLNWRSGTPGISF